MYNTRIYVVQKIAYIHGLWRGKFFTKKNMEITIVAHMLSQETLTPDTPKKLSQITNIRDSCAKGLIYATTFSFPIINNERPSIYNISWLGLIGCATHQKRLQKLANEESCCKLNSVKSWLTWWQPKPQAKNLHLSLNRIKLHNKSSTSPSTKPIRAIIDCKHQLSPSNA